MGWLTDLLNNPIVGKELWPAMLETLTMVGISTLATVLVGLPLGVALHATRKGGMAENRPVYTVLSAVVVNVTRSIPYAILMLSLIPLTRAIVGTSVGPVAASVSLSVAAIPFFARLVEVALRDIPSGKTDAAHAMGSTRFQTIWKVLLPEAMPALVAGITTTVVLLIGYSAMAGMIGGRGLGRLAYNYGYTRFMPEVMYTILVVLMLMVMVVQIVGDLIVRAVDHR